MDGPPRPLTLIDDGSGSASRRSGQRHSPPDEASDARFSVRLEDRDIRFLTARGDQPRVTQVLLEAVRELSGPLGLVIVEVQRVREWVVSAVPRARVLGGLVTLRDLLGQGPIDVAVFSTPMATEIFLDRWGNLEVRAGTWLEPRLRAILEYHGFREVPHLSTLPSQPAPTMPAHLYRDRLLAVTRELGVDSEPDSDPASSSGL